MWFNLITVSFYINKFYQYCNVDAQSVSRQRLDKHVPVNTQQWKLCLLWVMLQLVAR
jgi:hypothetical protein